MEGFSAAGKYAAELKQTASALVVAGKGILAADESSGTVGKRVSRRAIISRIANDLSDDISVVYSASPTLGVVVYDCQAAENASKTFERIFTLSQSTLLHVAAM